MLQILPITLAQVKVSNTLENLLNIQDIQDYFEYLIKKKHETLTDNPSVQV